MDMDVVQTLENGAPAPLYPKPNQMMLDVDPEERARLAMEDYLNQDDGQEAWLHFLEEEVNPATTSHQGSSSTNTSTGGSYDDEKEHEHKEQHNSKKDNEGSESAAIKMLEDEVMNALQEEAATLLSAKQWTRQTADEAHQQSQSQQWPLDNDGHTSAGFKENNHW
jgi:hypothetical protein